jgi:hypothetical protein
MWCRVDIVLTDVSEERIASIFRVEDKKKSASESVTLKMEEIRFSETSVNTISTRRQIPEDCFYISFVSEPETKTIT